MLVSRVTLIRVCTSVLMACCAFLQAQHEVPVHLEGTDLAPQVVVGPLGDLEFVTTFTANNQGAAECELMVTLGTGQKGAVTAQEFMINGESSSRFLYDVIPPNGSRQFRISGVSGSELFTGAAEINRLGEVSCVEAVEVSAKYEILHDDVVTELFSYPVSGSVPLGMCASVAFEFVPGATEPGFAAVSMREVPERARLQHYLRDQFGELIGEASEAFDGEHRARNLTEVFGDLEEVSGSWDVCFESGGPVGQGVYNFAPLFLNVTTSGERVQLGMAPYSVVNRGCLSDRNSVCLQKRFLVRVDANLAGSAGSDAFGFPTRSGAATFRASSGEGLCALVTVEDGCTANGHYWIMAEVNAGSSDTDFVLTVEDTLTGEVRQYTEAVKSAGSRSIVDSAAFAICSDSR